MMTILLDSHAFVWFVYGDPRCSTRAREAIESEGERAHVSAVTAWELSTKVRIGKWPGATIAALQMPEIIKSFDLTPLPITLDHGSLAGAFSAAHKDPFDRILAAQAALENLVLVTADPAFRLFGTRTLW